MTDWFAGKPKPEFDLDFSRGRRNEKLLDELLRNPDARVEVKTYYHPTQEAFVECYQNKHNLGTWHESGIKTTKADWWAYINQHFTAVYLYTTDTLRLAVRRAEEYRRDRDGNIDYRLAGSRGDNPTRGFWFPFRYLQGCALDVGDAGQFYNQEENDKDAR